MTHNRRTFLRAIGAGSIGLSIGALVSDTADAATVITLQGGGADIWGTEDAFHYYYAPVSGDFDVVVQNLFVEDTNVWAKAGLMVRETLDADSKNLMLRRRPTEEESVQWRPETGVQTQMTESSTNIYADWMRLKRAGDVIEAFGSQDEPAGESDWAMIRRFTADDITISDDAYLGLAVTSHNENVLCRATFKDLEGVGPTANRDIGSVRTAGSVSTETSVPFVSTDEPTDVTATSATLRGELTDLGGADTAECYFEYREQGATSWTTTPPETHDGTSAFTRGISGLSRSVTEYEYRAVIETSDGDDATGAIRRFTTSSIVSIETITNVSPTSATVEASVDIADPGAVEAVFEYRMVPRASWTATGSQTPTAGGSFARDLSELTSRRYYQIRATVETADGTPITSPVYLFNTAARTSSGKTGAGPDSVSHFDPADGFADLAPWLDDTTPIVPITEPTRRQLQAAVDIDGPRLVVFETSGTIDLDERRLVVSHDDLYLAGQTAPSPGITFVRGSFVLDANNCVIQHLRFRAGDAGHDTVRDWAVDSLTTDDDVGNNVIDHCTATWGTVENLSVAYRTTDTTVSNSLIAEALDIRYGYGSIGAGDDAENICWLGNVWALNRARNPNLGGRTAVVNNVVYHFNSGATPAEEAYSAIVGNSFLDPLDADQAPISNGHVYARDNRADPDTDPLIDVDERLGERPVWPAGLEAMPSADVYEHNLENAGARPADRTPHDERVIDLIRNRDGEYIESQTEVGGYPELAVTTHELTVPNGGTRAWLRSWARRVETPRN